MNYEFDIISESYNTSNNNVLNNYSNKDKKDIIWKPDSSINANQLFYAQRKWVPKVQKIIKRKRKRKRKEQK